jgi:hypothetical protein
MNLDKLKGPTSDRDIAFLKNLGANLDRWQKTGKVLDELQKVEAATQRLSEVARLKYGVPGEQASPAGAGPAPADTGPARVASDADYNALPSGTVFVGPDGKTRRKP